jgi:hypothetical protein
MLKYSVNRFLSWGRKINIISIPNLVPSTKTRIAGHYRYIYCIYKYIYVVKPV